jgi:hypothetical protein
LNLTKPNLYVESQEGKIKSQEVKYIRNQNYPSRVVRKKGIKPQQSTTQRKTQSIGYIQNNNKYE